MSDVAGSLLDGRYQLARELGRGPAGVLWEAQDLRAGSRVAVRTVTPGPETGEAGVERFLSEALTVGRLTHPHLVKAQERGPHYLVMEWLTGRTFDSLIAAGPTDLGYVLVWAQQACLALQAAHAERVVHWGLKPSRFLVTERGELKILGFGTAHLAPATALGATAYLAPEQWRQAPADGRADLYALGCVLYELCTGRPPYQGGSPQELMHRHLNDPAPYPGLVRGGVPVALDQLILALLTKDPAARPADAAEARRLLGAVAAGYQGPAGGDAAQQLRARVDQAWAVGEAGNTAEALRQLTVLAPETARVCGPGDPQTLQVCYDLAIWRGMADDVAGAVGLLADLVPMMTAVLGPGHEDVVRAQRDLASYRKDLSRGRYTGYGPRAGELAMLLGLPAYHPPA